MWIRLTLKESPAFQKMKDEGKTSKAPISEAFGEWKNLKIVILALVGLTAGQAVVWYTGQFYALFFLTAILKVDAKIANQLVAMALLFGTPFFVFFGALSDKIGRKPIIMAGCLIAALSYIPLFGALTEYANPALANAQKGAQVTVIADEANCHAQFDPVGKTKFLSSCDIPKSFLAKAGVPYTNQAAPAGTVAQIKIGEQVINSFEGTLLTGESQKAELKAKQDAFGKEMKAALKVAGYPEKADSNAINKPMVVFILTILVIFVTMVYGPIAAMLVEMFPTRIRYTSMSLPYHVGNGWFGGLLPTISFAMVASSGDIYYGLRYPIAVALMTFVIGMIFVKETRNTDIDKAQP
jgi:MFS family permease